MIKFILGRKSRALSKEEILIEAVAQFKRAIEGRE